MLLAARTNSQLQKQSAYLILRPTDIFKNWVDITYMDYQQTNNPIAGRQAFLMVIFSLSSKIDVSVIESFFDYI